MLATWSSCTFFLALGLVFGMDTLASQAAGAGTAQHIAQYYKEITSLWAYYCKIRCSW